MKQEQRTVCCCSGLKNKTYKHGSMGNNCNYLPQGGPHWIAWFSVAGVDRNEKI